MYKKEEMFDKCRVALIALEVLDGPEKDTMALIAQDYLEALGSVIGISESK